MVFDARNFLDSAPLRIQTSQTVGAPTSGYHEAVSFFNKDGAGSMVPAFSCRHTV